MDFVAKTHADSNPPALAKHRKILEWPNCASSGTFVLVALCSTESLSMKKIDI